ncbi:aminotransferase class V-fold PLP-dependent enzyme [Candidatus Woesearchaeota archaeon]|nr:aminotransferase class V-fold PLP-dependent enzyme [Candidatus Woesearchaeota archaeon]
MVTRPAPLNELSRPGAVGYRLPPLDVPEVTSIPGIPESDLRKDLKLPELTEYDAQRQFEARNASVTSVGNVDLHALGSCTMEHSPAAIMNPYNFPWLHPWQPQNTMQGALELQYELKRILCELGGAYDGTLQPAAGAHGELTAMLMVAAYHRHNGSDKDVVLIPDSAHGTNPATAAMAGYKVVVVASDRKTGRLDVADLEAKLYEHGNKVAALMITQPSTFGIYDPNIRDITDSVHRYGGLVFCDGANFAALVGNVLLCQLGVDAYQLNLHKTLGVPHGGGGPGAGFVGVNEKLAPFLPTFQYLLLMGSDGLREQSLVSVLHGNFLHEGLTRIPGLAPAFPGLVAHEGLVVVTDALRLPYVGSDGKPRHLGVGDFAKGIISLLDDGHRFHAPTIGFPSVPREGAAKPESNVMLTEPTHSVSKRDIEAYLERVRHVIEIAMNDPKWLADAPYNTPSARIEEAEANRHPVLTWDMSSK